MIDTSHPINAYDFSVASVHTSSSTSSTIRGINGKIHSSWVVLHLRGVWWSCLSGTFWVQQLGDMDLWWKKAWTQPTETVGKMSIFPGSLLNLSCQLLFVGFWVRHRPVEFLHVENTWEHVCCRILVSKNGTFQGILWVKGEIKRWWIFKHQHLPTLRCWCLETSPGLSLSKHR